MELGSSQVDTRVVAPAAAQPRRRDQILAALGGLALSALVVLLALYGLGRWAGGQRQGEMRAIHAALPVYAASELRGSSENWDNLLLYWQSESVLPRIVDEYSSGHPIGAINTFYRGQPEGRGLAGVPGALVALPYLPARTLPPRHSLPAPLRSGLAGRRRLPGSPLVAALARREAGTRYLRRRRRQPGPSLGYRRNLK